MSVVKTSGARIAGISTCVPSTRFDNMADAAEFSQTEIRKVTGMAGVLTRRVAGESVCSSDLCIAASRRLLDSLGWEPASVDALIMVTQTPDYFMPSTACVVHQQLGLSDRCAAFDVGLGCSGYPYGLWLASMMLQGGGIRRVLLLHGETPTRFTDKADRSVALLFGDAGSATALEAAGKGSTGEWHFALHSDGTGSESLIIEAGGFRDRFSKDERKHCVSMDGAQVFNFTVKRIPALIDERLSLSRECLKRISTTLFFTSRINSFLNIYAQSSRCRLRRFPSSSKSSATQAEFQFR
jgi:3-oxoacyl-[acyl-carrier-protein] synthase-3